MSSKDAAINQKNIDKYFKGWIGVSVSNRKSPEESLSTLFLEFSSQCHATSAFLFLSQWQNFQSEQSLRFSLIEETDGQLSCYFYTPGTTFSKKATFKGNFNLKKIKQFNADRQKHPEYQVVTRYADKNYDVSEVEDKQDAKVRLNSVTFKRRGKVKEGKAQVE